jgi:hypothetical protein
MYVLPFDEQLYEHVPVASCEAASCGAEGSLLVPANAAVIIMAAATIHLDIGNLLRGRYPIASVEPRRFGRDHRPRSPSLRIIAAGSPKIILTAQARALKAPRGAQLDCRHMGP